MLKNHIFVSELHSSLWNGFGHQLMNNVNQRQDNQKTMQLSPQILRKMDEILQFSDVNIPQQQPLMQTPSLQLLPNSEQITTPLLGK